MLDEPLLRALGFRPQPVWVRAVVHRTFRLRAACIRLLPARPERFPRGPKPRTYPFGWTLDDLGPHWAQSRPLEPLRDEGPASGTPADPEVADPEPPGTEPSAQKPSDRRRRQGGSRSPAAPAVRAPREETP